jgi:hypothetical protein
MVKEMDLPTHALFGFAVGLVFFGHPEIALLVLIGAMIPDLDRNWFENMKAAPEERRHRALFHNVFLMAGIYVISPFIALGAFLHMLQDSFTTAKDRGCEWFYPLSRLVKRGLYDANGMYAENAKQQPLDPKENVYFYQEDPENIETGKTAIPWRRVYGPALNSRLLDRFYLFGSLGIAVMWFVAQSLSNVSSLTNNMHVFWQHLLLLSAVVILLVVGAKLNGTSYGGISPATSLAHWTFRKVARYILATFSVVLLFVWVYIFANGITSNLEALASSWGLIVGGSLIVVGSCLILLKYYTRKGRTRAIV